MGLFTRRKSPNSVAKTAPDGYIDGPADTNVNGTTGSNTPPLKNAAEYDDTPYKVITGRVIVMGMIVSLGGMIFGFDTGQISGFLEMPDFIARFGEPGGPTGYYFSNVRSGTIVGLLSIGTLVGALIAAPLADAFGRKYTITFWNIIFIVGVIVQITSTYNWVQIVVGRLIAGFGVGALSVMTPMYMSETAPRQIRGALVSSYQLFITLGIFIADCINYGTEMKYKHSAESWRITMGVGFIWPVLMGVGILFLRESPRWEYRHGRTESAQKTVSLMYGVSEHHAQVHREIADIKAKLDAENAGGVHHWYEALTGPRMPYRLAVGMTLQMLQQLTGANYFFYYGTTVFAAVGIESPYVTAMILGGINFIFTFPGLYLVENAGRRKSLIIGGIFMSVCFIIFASVGHTQLTDGKMNHSAGIAMIVFAAFFIVAFASTWGPMIWCVTSEIYPTRYRATSLALTTASNWIWNFMLAFFTPFITADIDYLYGFVFAGCCLAGAAVVYFFVCESAGRTLEEIDTMYILHVTPWRSSGWEAPIGEDLVNADALYLSKGGRGINKQTEANAGQTEHRETVV